MHDVVNVDPLKPLWPATKLERLARADFEAWYKAHRNDDPANLIRYVNTGEYVQRPTLQDWNMFLVGYKALAARAKGVFE